MTDRNIDRRCQEAINKNRMAWRDFKDREDGALNFLVGQVMQISGGRAKPEEIREKFQEIREEES